MQITKYKTSILKVEGRDVEAFLKEVIGVPDKANARMEIAEHGGPNDEAVVNVMWNISDGRYGNSTILNAETAEIKKDEFIHGIVDYLRDKSTRMPIPDKQMIKEIIPVEFGRGGMIFNINLLA